MQRSFNARSVLVPWTNRIALIGAGGIMLIAAAVTADVLMRWLFNSPIMGVDDLSTLMIAVVVSSFFPAGLVGGHFVTIRFLGKALGTRGGCWLEVLGGIGTLFIFSLLAWQFFRFTLYDVTQTGLATMVLEFPQAPWWWVVTTFIAACVPLQLTVVVDAVIRAIRGGPPAYELHQEAETGG